jgi:hypothetical protein
MLSIRQERVAGEDIRVPKGETTLLNALQDEALPDIVFQHQVGEQQVMRRANA